MTRKVLDLIKAAALAAPLVLSGAALAQTAGGSMNGAPTGGVNSNDQQGNPGAIGNPPPPVATPDTGNTMDTGKSDTSTSTDTTTTTTRSRTKHKKAPASPSSPSTPETPPSGSSGTSGTSGSNPSY